MTLPGLARIGFLYPWLLLLIPCVLGFLWYVYRRKGREERLPVASLLFLRQVVRPVRSRRRFFPPLRFFLELLVFLLLVAALAGMFKDEPHRKIALLIDNSLSMGAVSIDGAISGTTFEQARSDVRRLLGTISGDAVFDLLVTSPRIQKLNEEPVSGGEVIEMLAAQRAESASDNLEAALQKLAQDDTYDQIHVFTDRAQSGRPTDAPSALTLHPLRPAESATRPQNVAILDLQLDVPGASSNRQQVRAKVAAFTNQSVQITVTLYAFLEDGTRQMIAERQASVDPQKPLAVDFSLSGKVAAAYQATLEVRGPESFRYNALTADDSAYLSFESGGGQLLLVSDLSAQELGLTQLGSMSVSHLTPEQYGNAGSTLQGKTIVFHRVMPEQLPASNSLFIAPATSGGEVTVGPLEKDAQVTTWDASSPLTTYTNLPALRIPALRPLTGPAWAENVVRTSRGTALLSAEKAGRRYAFVGFELLPYQGKKSPVLSIVLLNALKWLSDSALSAGYQAPFSTLEAAERTERVAYVGGEKLWESGQMAEAKRILLPRSGLVEIISADGRSFRAINFFSEGESDLLSIVPVTLPKMKAREDQQQQPSPFTRELAGLLLALLCLDLLYTSIRILRQKVSQGAVSRG